MMSQSKRSQLNHREPMDRFQPRKPRNEMREIISNMLLQLEELLQQEKLSFLHELESQLFKKFDDCQERQKIRKLQELFECGSLSCEAMELFLNHMSTCQLKWCPVHFCNIARRLLPGSMRHIPEKSVKESSCFDKLYHLAEQFTGAQRVPAAQGVNKSAVPRKNVPKNRVGGRGRPFRLRRKAAFIREEKQSPEVSTDSAETSNLTSDGVNDSTDGVLSSSEVYRDDLVAGFVRDFIFSTNTLEEDAYQKANSEDEYYSLFAENFHKYICNMKVQKIAKDLSAIGENVASKMAIRGDVNQSTSEEKQVQPKDLTALPEAPMTPSQDAQLEISETSTAKLEDNEVTPAPPDQQEGQQKVDKPRDNSESKIILHSHAPNKTEQIDSDVSDSKVKVFAIADYVNNLEHAIVCGDSNCKKRGCDLAKRFVQHSRVCEYREKGGCNKVCRPSFAVCNFHARRCNKNDCLMPYCSFIKGEVARVKAKFLTKSTNDQLEKETVVPEEAEAQNATPPARRNICHRAKLRARRLADLNQ
ncbi:Hypothetical predicted protein [Cloeon dipterum]|uniref:histone acetyltransferase n=1 Tax=Cloeon dipterum TaxID=197152 RepID=A0A8S1BW70_9INSE|nr:Hypothetical predicted protein [Cloeon dipterum]